MNSFWIGLVLAAFLSTLVGTIEVLSRSKVATLRNCISGAFLLYLVFLAIGNTVTTALVAAVTDNVQPQPEALGRVRDDLENRETNAKRQVGSVLRHMPWFWYAFLGVFGFEVLLQNINVTFLGRGMLSISDWIGKARDSAVEAAVKAQVAVDNAEA